MDKDFELKVMYEMLERWPKIAALLGEAQPGTDLYNTLVNGTDVDIREELKRRDITQAEVQAFTDDIKPWLALAQQQGGWVV